MSAHVDLLVGEGQWLTHADPAGGARALRLSDGPSGLRRERADGSTIPATCFPPAATLAASWDPDLLEEVGVALGEEAHRLGVDVLLAPGVNLKRTPLCGRNFEYLSEDPLLAGVLGAAYVRGVQSMGVAASVKHFAANNQEHRRHSVSAEVDERSLRELYLSAFERIVAEASPWTLMCAYNRLNGVHASQHHWLLTRVLREEWGYDGLVVSDWGAVHDPVAAVRAGLDLQMPGDDAAPPRLRAALADRSLPEAAVAQAADRVRRLAQRCGPERPTTGIEDVAPAHDQLARRAAAAGTVLLANDGTLPLTLPARSRLVVIGRQASRPVIQGSGSAEVVPTAVSTLQESLRQALPDVRVEFAPGYDWEELVEGRRVPRDPDSPAAQRLRAQALALASGADAVVVCLGHPHGIESEGYDRLDLDLPADQDRLVAELVLGAAPVVAGLTTGAPLVLGEWRHQLAALLLPGFGGQAGGAALADVLLGVSEPGGRLAETWPLRLTDSPAAPTYPGERGTVRYGEGVFVGYRWYDALEREVAYPFGHGLGYTTTALTGIEAVVVDPARAVVEVRIGVRNTGERPGGCVVQVYTGEVDPVLPRPPRELRAFARVRLEPGEQREVTVELDGRAWAFWDVVGAAWQRTPGRFTIAAGLSSRDLPLSTTVTLPADPAQPRFVDEDALAERLQGR